MTDTNALITAAVRQIPVKDLSVVWAQAQRPLDERHAKRIADNFDADMFGVLLVTSADGNGHYHVVDGQHRRWAVQSLFGDDRSVPCIVAKADDPARAAQLFDRINWQRKSPKPVTRFLVRIVAGEEDEIAINNIVQRVGYRIHEQCGRGQIVAVSALATVYRRSGHPFGQQGTPPDAEKR